MLKYQQNQLKIRHTNYSGELVVNIVNCLQLRSNDYMGITDSFVKCLLYQNELIIHQFDTNWISNSNDPRWDFNRKLRLNNLNPISEEVLQKSKKDNKIGRNSNIKQEKGNQK